MKGQTPLKEAEIGAFYTKQLTSAQYFPPSGEVVQANTSGGETGGGDGGGGDGGGGSEVVMTYSKVVRFALLFLIPSAAYIISYTISVVQAHIDC